MRRTILVLLILMACVLPVAADTIYLRDGRTVRGTVLGFIGGRFAVRVPTSGTNATTGGLRTTRPGDEEGEVQFFRPRDVERVEIEGRSLEEARFTTRTVEVALAPNWIDSGVELRRGERVQVRASGTIVAGRTRITPDGLRSTDPNAPLPRASEGALIGAVSNDPNAPIIELGSTREFVADRDGRLYLTANRSTYTDARGAFNVQVRTERNLTPTRRTDTANNRRNNDDEDDIFGGVDDNSRVEPAPTRPRTPGGGIGGGLGDPTRNRPSRPRDMTIDIPATSRGTDTRIDLSVGDRVTIEATGQIVAGRRVGSVPPEGGRAGIGSVFASTYPLPQAGPGALIGYIRTSDGQASQPFLVGSRLEFTAQSEGRLILLVNDDNYGDNSGSFSVTIRY
ncbi:MAG TPA: hypothetical protein VF666_00435 [Pyrinomonadaceae bacterium]|jgi:hypothetical protein